MAKKYKNQFRNFLTISRNLANIFFGTPFFKKIQKSVSTNFLANLGNLEQLWFLSFLTNFFPQTPIFFRRVGLINSKIFVDQFSCHFKEFGTPLFFSFLTNFFPNPYIFLGGGLKFLKNFSPFHGGVAKISKTHFDQFSRHFMQVWTTLIFVNFAEFF